MPPNNPNNQYSDHIPSPAPLGDLLAGIRRGDRDAAAELGMRYASEIRRRIRGQLGPEMRRLFDSQDILSTVLRRLDVYVRDHDVTADSEREVRALLLKICNNAVIDKVRVIKRLKRTEGEDSPFANMLLQMIGTGSHRHNSNESGDLVRFFDALASDEDRKILWLWLAGNEQASIAKSMDMPYGTLRKRWQRIREHLKSVIKKDLER